MDMKHGRVGSVFSDPQLTSTSAEPNQGFEANELYLDSEPESIDEETEQDGSIRIGRFERTGSIK